MLTLGVLVVLSRLTSQANLSRKTCHGRPVLDFLFWLFWMAILPGLSCRSCPVPSVLFVLSCSRRPVLFSLSWLFCLDCPLLLSCFGCPIRDVLSQHPSSQLSIPPSPAIASRLTILSYLSCLGCPVLVVLSPQASPGTHVRSSPAPGPAHAEILLPSCPTVLYLSLLRCHVLALLLLLPVLPSGLSLHGGPEH
jgi:hypothetical protein